MSLETGVVHGAMVLSLLLDLAVMEKAVRPGSGMPVASGSYRKKLFSGGLPTEKSVIPPDLMVVGHVIIGHVYVLYTSRVVIYLYY
jgi:hypothetical protein